MCKREGVEGRLEEYSTRRDSTGEAKQKERSRSETEKER